MDESACARPGMAFLFMSSGPGRQLVFSRLDAWPHASVCARRPASRLIPHDSRLGWFLVFLSVFNLRAIAQSRLSSPSEKNWRILDCAVSFDDFGDVLQGQLAFLAEDYGPDRSLTGDEIYLVEVHRNPLDKIDDVFL